MTRSRTTGTSLCGRRRAAGRGERGMTLIEIVLVLAILGVVMGLLFGPALLDMFKGGKESAAKILVDKFANQAYVQWQIKTGEECPDSIDALAKYAGKKDAKDPYKTPMQMLCGDDLPEEAAQGFGVVSAGPNKKHGDDDDIRSWESLDEREARMGKNE